MRLFYSNHVDIAGAVITPSTEDASFPASNLANELKSKVWRTKTTQAAENVVFDLLTAKAVTSVIIFAHTLLNTDTNIKLEGNATNSWGAPSFTQALTWDATAIKAVFASQSFRYWRVSFTKASAGVSRDIGRIFLGTYTDTSVQPDFDGFTRERADLSVRQRTTGGQIYTDVRSNYRVINLDWAAVPQADVTALDTIAVAVGTFKSFFVQIDTASSGELAEVLYVKFQKPIRPKTDGMDGAGLTYAFDMDLEEML